MYFYSILTAKVSWLSISIENTTESPATTLQKSTWTDAVCTMYTCILHLQSPAFFFPAVAVATMPGPTPPGYLHPTYW